MNNTNINTRNPIQGILKERGVKRFDEERLIRNFIKAAGLDSSARILDVGCGLGEKMQWLVEDGYTPHGIDINPYVVEKIRNKGFYCITPEDFSKVNYTYDLMLMSHIIEHFYPDDLLIFIDKYLDRLKTGGYVVIATPLEWNNFYGDFDHIKIYHPQTFITLSRRETQQQYYSRHRLKLVCLGLRRQPWECPVYEDHYCKLNNADFLWRLSRSIKHRLSRFIFKYSGGSLGGVTTGWVGMFQKEAQL